MYSTKTNDTIRYLLCVYCAVLPLLHHVSLFVSCAALFEAVKPVRMIAVSEVKVVPANAAHGQHRGLVPYRRKFRTSSVVAFLCRNTAKQQRQSAGDTPVHLASSGICPYCTAPSRRHFLGHVSSMCCRDFDLVMRACWFVYTTGTE